MEHKLKEVKCGKCQTHIATRTRKQENPYTTKNGATLLLREGQAPLIRCPCGHPTFVLPGSL